MSESGSTQENGLLPKKVHQINPTTLGIDWNDGHESSFSVRKLRLNCPCANCIDEWTGERRLDPKSVPDNIKPVNLKSVGLYAVQFYWNDGHDTGLYTYDLLRKLCECRKCST